MDDSKDDRIKGLEVKLESMIEMYNQVHAERDQLQGEVGALREERETLLTRITELEATLVLSEAYTGTTYQWLIERGQPEGLLNAVWLENSGAHPASHRRWTNVAHESAMFPDRESAERYIVEEGLEARAVEHGFTHGGGGQET